MLTLMLAWLVTETDVWKRGKDEGVEVECEVADPKANGLLVGGNAKLEKDAD